ncbi:unnamed protein product [Urochloa decumbens]|uniref:F-box domain-containing protein n=1 Tax=Urochloa decumbens TaxID=240449 RepID=A0ABC9AQ65_9POAL
MDPAEATRKRARPRRRRRAAAGPDLLSALPDCLLHAIMSSLKARQAVQTCVLSTRWRDLWRSVPCLDIDLDEFRAETVAVWTADAECSISDHSIASSVGADSFGSSDDSSDSDDSSSGSDVNSSDSENDDISDSDLDSSDSSSSSSSSDDDDDSKKNKQWEDWKKFEDFTMNLMACCNIAQLDSFRLHIGRCKGSKAPPTSFRQRQAAGCLRRAMKYCAPDPPGQCKVLRSGSWRLKRLHLGHVRLDDRFAKHISSVCLSLEDLELQDCSCRIRSVTSDSLKNLVLRNCTLRNLSEIASPSLKTLVIDGGANANDCVLDILTPAVTYLHLAVNFLRFQGSISTNEMPSLVKTSIDFHDYKDTWSEDNKLGGVQFKILCSVSNATSLELSGLGKKVLSKERTFQEFTNLRNLFLGSCDLSNNFRTLEFFLQSSPNLEKLTLHRCKFPAHPKKKKGKLKLVATSSSEFHGFDFMCENLKVEIIYKDVDARKLVKLLLHAAGNLSKNNITLTKVN